MQAGSHQRSAAGSRRGESYFGKRCRSALCLAFVLALALPAFAARVVEDETGRAVALPDRAHRILCLAPSITDTVFAIGAGADVAGITDYTKYPPEARGKPSVGEVLRPSLERIAVQEEAGVDLHPVEIDGDDSFFERTVAKLIG